MGRESAIALRGGITQELPEPNRTYPSGRTCAWKGCATRLSIYNEGPFCWAHAGPSEGTFPRSVERGRSHGTLGGAGTGEGGIV